MKLIQNFINWLKGLFNAIFNPQVSQTPAESVPTTRSNKGRNLPAWWKRLYNIRERNLLVSTGLQPLKTFGTFDPVPKIKGLVYNGKVFK